MLSRVAGVVAESDGGATDAVLLQRYQAGDLEAFQQLFVRHARTLHAFLLYTTLNAVQARNLSEQTWLRVHRSRHRWTPLDKPLRQWLFGVAASLRRQQSRSSSTTARAGDSGVFEPPPLHESGYDLSPPAGVPAWVGDWLWQALAALPVSYREVVVLHRICHLSFADIASALGATESTVRWRAHQAYVELGQKAPVAAADSPGDVNPASFRSGR